MNVTELEKEIIAINERLASIQKTYLEEKKSLEAERAKLLEDRTLLLGGLDMSLIGIGREIMEVRGTPSQVVHGMYSDQRRDGLRESKVDAAIIDLLNGATKMEHEYFGVKNYSGFGDQGCDCRYLCGPRHGSIVFSIGLKREYRGKELTPEQIDACIYFLRNLAKVHEAKQAA